MLAVEDKRTRRCQHLNGRVGQSTVSTLINSFLEWPSDVRVCSGNGVPSIFENLRFYVEPGTYKARVHTTLRNTERWLHVSAAPPVALLRSTRGKDQRIAFQGWLGEILAGQTM